MLCSQKMFPVHIDSANFDRCLEMTPYFLRFDEQSYSVKMDYSHCYWLFALTEKPQISLVFAPIMELVVEAAWDSSGMAFVSV